MNSATRRHFLAASAALPALAAARRPEPKQPAGLLAGKVAVIYGAAGDIGSGVARAFAQEGAYVCLTGITLQKVERLGSDIAAAGGRCEAARVDAPRRWRASPAAIAEHARAAGVTLEEFTARIADKTMLKRMPAVAEIASAAVIMASDRASAVTAAVTNLTCGEIAD